jgi:predicted short-subunit dehydrogenase-like oxidoreductase (DUF2520 family)
LKNSGINIDYIYSRNEIESISLAKKLNAKETLNLQQLSKSDMVLICVPDDIVYEFINKTPNTTCAYTSGSIKLTKIQNKNIGVFYPLQTFRKKDKIDIEKVPIFVEATNELFQNQLVELAKKISKNVSIVNSEERSKYHLSAVFLNNFTNHLLYLSKKEADKNGLRWDNLLPLLEETLKKNLISNPFDNQTGPAKRNDLITIEKHLSMLDGQSKEIYQVITESIKSTYHD